MEKNNNKYIDGMEISLSPEKVNTHRQLEFDYVKAIAIIGMIIIHVYEELSIADCGLPVTDFYNGFLQFIGGPMAAPVFTFAMGMGIAYSKNNSPEQLIKRGIKLFLCGYLLNFVRDTLPYCIMGGELFNDEFFYLLLNVDIFHMDGLAFILIGIFHMIGISDIFIVGTAIVMQAVGYAVIPLISINSLVGRCLIGLFVFTGTESCFPITLWFIYVILGLWFAHWLKHVGDRDLMYKRFLITSALLLLCYCVTLAAQGYDLRNFFSLADDIYYQQNFLSTIFTVLIIMLELSLGHFILRDAKVAGIHERVKWMSSNLTTIYVIQWLLIGWTEYIVLDLLGIEGIDAAWVIPAGLIYLLAAVVITWLYKKYLKNKH